MSSTSAKGTTRLVFLHVGKTGGTSAIQALNMAKGKNYVKNCTLPITVSEVHMDRPDKTVLDSGFPVMSVRDPIARVVSAFNYRHPARGGNVHHKALPGAPDADPLEVELYSCFDHVNSFAEALTDATHCGDVARRAFTCCDVREMPLYIFFGQGLEYYMGWPAGSDIVHFHTVHLPLGAY